MNSYIKHLIECDCVLPQFQLYRPPVFHKFVVFSIILEDGEIQPSFAQCPNCGAVHKVTEVLTSTRIAKDSLSSLPSVDEIKKTLPKRYTETLETYHCDVSTWQEVKFIIDHELWGKAVVHSREVVDGEVTGKYMIVLGQDLLKIDSYLN